MCSFCSFLSSHFLFYYALHSSPSNSGIVNHCVYCTEFLSGKAFNILWELQGCFMMFPFSYVICNYHWAIAFPFFIFSPPDLLTNESRVSGFFPSFLSCHSTFLKTGKDMCNQDKCDFQTCKAV